MKEIIASTGKILEINLTTRMSRELEISQLDRMQYLGGKGLGMKYLLDRLTPGIDPLSDENWLIFMMGVFPGTGAPCSGRFSAITKSPLTGIITSSSCGGPFGIACKTSGYEGLIITGKCETPIYLEICDEYVHYIDATSLWGQGTFETQTSLKLGKEDGALVIGPAGENLVYYAAAASGHRFLGRGGIGAVMGSKKLKAIVAKGGKYKIAPFDRDRFTQARNHAIRQINQNHFTSTLYREYGTNANISFCNDAGILPVENFRTGSHPMARTISGEETKRKYNTKPSTCLPCTILCGHKGTYPDGSIHQMPEYETNAMFGPNLGIFDHEKITEWSDICGRLGMDTISTAGTLAFVMEAGEKGLIKTDLKFGSTTGVSEMLMSIANRQGQGNELANGSRWLAQKYGGEEFAIHVKGMEMSAYDPRGSWGQGLAFAVANRGACHLSATIFPLEIFFGLLNPKTTRAKPQFVKFMEDLYAAINSLPTCLFTTFAYVLEAPVVKLTPRFLLSAVMQFLPLLAITLMDISTFTSMVSSVLGIKINKKEFLEAGERIHLLERYLNTREGICRNDDILPRRFIELEVLGKRKKKPVPLEKMLDTYYHTRGYDKNGVPKPKILYDIGILTKIKPLS